jgi:hypothetical protein
MTILPLVISLLSHCYGRCFPAVMSLFRGSPATEKSKPGQGVAFDFDRSRRILLKNSVAPEPQAALNSDPKRLDSIAGDQRNWRKLGHRRGKRWSGRRHAIAVSSG